MLQTDHFIHVGEEFRQNPIQSQDIVLSLKTGWTEQVANVIGGGKTDTEIVRHIVSTELFVLDQRFGKIQRELIARRTNREQGRVILAVCAAPGVRKGATESGQIGLPWAVIRIAEQVGFLRV